MNIAFFDFDGTVTNQDTYTQFVLFAMPKRKLAFGKLFLFPTIIKYKLGRLHGQDIRTKMTRFAFKGMSIDDLSVKGAAFANHVIPVYIRSNALEKIKWHQNRGDLVVIVSASLDVYLKPWCDKHQLDLICTEIEVIDGVITGNTISGDCSSSEKQKRIEARYNLEDYDTIYAYGDTPEDTEMLALAQPEHRFYRYF